MNNFTNKKTSLNTTVDFSAKNDEPFNAIEPKRVSVADSADAFYKMIESGLKQTNMENKEKAYICIVDECEYMIGTLAVIETWIDDNCYDVEDNDLVIYELKSDKEINCSFERKTSISIK